MSADAPKSARQTDPHQSPGVSDANASTSVDGEPWVDVAEMDRLERLDRIGDALESIAISAAHLVEILASALPKDERGKS